MAHPKSLVSTEWVADNINSIKLVDGSWHLPVLKRNALEEYRAKHLKNARFFDIDDVSDKSINLPHMLPSSDHLAKHVGGVMGISDADHVVIYDSVGIGPACRVYWTFRVFGHEKVSVVDGGLVKWLAENRPTEAGQPSFSPATYKPSFKSSLVKNYEQIREAVASGSSTVIDARPAARFQGVAPEPRPGLPSGHMPISISIPFTEVVDPEAKTLLPAEQLQKLFAGKGVDLEKPIITSCGSGVTASIIYFALEKAGAKNISVYDGSWSEYASIKDSPIEDRGPK
ncbi:hypothetical protein HDV00_011903 [Rhizophlyctis rosea]|nr:hypothetical protein HDV00_011903 [Rhizophlyctis rosea]